MAFAVRLIALCFALALAMPALAHRGHDLPSGPGDFAIAMNDAPADAVLSSSCAGPEDRAPSTMQADAGCCHDDGHAGQHHVCCSPSAPPPSMPSIAMPSRIAAAPVPPTVRVPAVAHPVPERPPRLG